MPSRHEIRHHGSPRREPGEFAKSVSGVEISRQSVFERLRSGRIDTAETSSLHLDALRYLKDVNAHLVAGAAYPVLESKGELLASRPRQDM
jgi:hypothetical protein